MRVAAGAFGPGRPHTELFLSPDHAVYVNAVLIPMKHLINGSTIVQVPVDRVTYHHIELAQHDVVLAQGPAGGEFSGYAGRLQLREPSRADAAVSGFLGADVGGVRLRAADRHGTGTGGGACAGRTLRDGGGGCLIGPFFNAIGQLR